jgi:cephalosporin-C deacetylase
MSKSDSSTHRQLSIAKVADFEEFWQNTTGQLTHYPPTHATMRLDQQADIVHYDVTFNSWLDTAIKGYFLQWTGAKSRPLLVYTHGYNGNCEAQWEWAQKGFNVFGFDTRGFGRSIIPVHREGWILTGIESPELSILRGAICDFVRATEIARALAGESIERTLFYGFSFGGAMALMAEALTQAADLVAAGAPSFGWMAGRHKLAKMGSGHEIDRHILEHPELENRTMHTLSYFDTARFAPFIKKPCLIGIGQRDIVVPAETVRAICDNLQAPHVIREFPYSHTSQPEERLWQNFEREWIEMGLTGQLPPVSNGT